MNFQTNGGQKWHEQADEKVERYRQSQQTHR